MTIKRNCLLAALIMLGSLFFGAPQARSTRTPKHGYVVYVGTYTGAQSKGIYSFHFQPSTGDAGEASLAAETGNPSWLAVDPRDHYLYAANEYNSEKDSVSAFRIDRASGKLAPLNSVSSGGRGTCHLSVDRTGRNLLLASYNSGTVAVRRINDDGSIGEQTAFDQHSGPADTPPHAHSMYLSPDQKFVLGADLGLNRVLVYHFDAANGTLRPNSPPYATLPFHSGPRHLAFHPDGKILYLIEEISGTIVTFEWNRKDGTLHPLQTISTIPDGFAGKNNAQEIQVSSDGRFVYASNGGPSTIAVFAAGKNGLLTEVQQAPTQGALPRGMAIDPSGNYLFVANQKGNDVQIFHIDRKTGHIAADKTIAVGSPVAFVFVPEN